MRAIVISESTKVSLKVLIPILALLIGTLYKGAQWAVGIDKRLARIEFFLMMKQGFTTEREIAPRPVSPIRRIGSQRL